MIAVIPARGGSKGVPRKNIRKINGRPLIGFAISNAMKAKSISRVFVSTEDEEIAEIAKSCGAEVPFLRPQSLATDTAPNGAACLHLCKMVAEFEKIHINEFALMQPTSPFLSPEEVDACVKLFKEQQPDAVVGIAEQHFPMENMLILTKEGRIKNALFNEYGISTNVKQRQLFGKRYGITGGISILKLTELEKDLRYFHKSPNSVGFLLSEMSGFDIDTEFELEIAKKLMGTDNEA